MNLSLCFVVMPFGKKPNISGGVVNFDAVYKELIGPGVISEGVLYRPRHCQ
jgi:hypothetical protein